MLFAAIPSVAEEVRPESATPEDSTKIQSSPLREIFYSALKSFNSGDAATASEKFDTLQARGLGIGHINFPDYSFNLISQAKSLAATDKIHEAKYLVRRAHQLSPSDPRVAFALASLSDLLTFSEMVSYFSKGVFGLYKSPSSLIKTTINFVLVALVSFSIAMLIVCLIQVLCSGDSIIKKFAKWLPEKNKGIYAPICFIVCAIIPTFLGVLACIVIWAAIVTITKQRARGLLLAAGVLCLVWGGMLSLIQTASIVSKSKNIQIYEALNNGSFIEDLLPQAEVLALHSDRPFIPQYAYATALFRNQQYEKAIEYFEKSRSTSSKALDDTVRISLAATYMKLDQLGKADALLNEVADNTSFVFYFNKAHLRLAQLNTKEHTTIYTLAKERDPERAALYEQAEHELTDSLLAPIPWHNFYPLFLQPSGFANVKAEEKLGVLISSMLRGGSVELVLIVGVIAFLLGLKFYFMKHRYRMPRKDLERSHIWTLIPGGLLISGEYPVSGTIVLSIMLSLILFILEKPLYLLDIAPIELNFAGPLQYGAVGIYVLIFALSFASLLLNKETAEEEVC